MTGQIEVKALDFGQGMEHGSGIPLISHADGLVGVRMTGQDKDTGQDTTMVCLLTPSEAADLAILLAKAASAQRHKHTPPAEAPE